MKRYNGILHTLAVNLACNNHVKQIEYTVCERQTRIVFGRSR